MDFSKDELRILIHMIAAYRWILQARTGSSPDSAFLDLEQKLLKEAHGSGLGNAIETDSVSGAFKLAPLPQSAPEMLAQIMAHEDETFWDLLIERMVQRDMVYKVGREGYRQLTDDAFSGIEVPLRALYEHEFDEHGLSRLILPESE